MKSTGPAASGDWVTEGNVMRYSDDHMAVVSERVISPSRKKPKDWTTVRRKKAVVIAAMTQDNRLILIRQERIPIRETIWEMPAGQVDEAAASETEFAETALRELREETGYELSKGGELISLGYFFASPGFTDEEEHIFLARPVERANDDKWKMEESIADCRAFSIDEVREMILKNELRDANTLSAFARMVARGLIQLPRSAE